jgi:hypothetical protein
VRAPTRVRQFHTRLRPVGRAYDRPVNGEDWRVEVELDDEEHGFSLGERLRALDLDDEARKRLGRRVIVTRDGSRLFLYTRSRQEAEEAARIVRELLRAERLTAELRTTRWVIDAEEWQESGAPSPADAEGHGWSVQVRASDRAEAVELEERLRGERLPVERRWSYLTVGAQTEEQAEELAARLRRELPGTEVEIDATADVPDPLFVLVRSWL